MAEAVRYLLPAKKLRRRGNAAKSRLKSKP